MLGALDLDQELKVVGAEQHMPGSLVEPLGQAIQAVKPTLRPPVRRSTANPSNPARDHLLICAPSAHIHLKILAQPGWAR